MALSADLRSVLKIRGLVLAAVLAATLAALLAIYRPSLSPPGLHQRDLTVSAASTEILVADPRNLPDSDYAYAVSVNRALVVGNTLLSQQVLGQVAGKLGLQADAISGTPPVTPNVPAALVTPGPSSSPLDIFSSPNHYKLEIEADPSTPFLWLYAQAPSAKRAVALADDAAQSLIADVRQNEKINAVPPAKWIHIEQIGRAVGGTAPTTAVAQIAIIVWLGVLCLFLLCAAALRATRRGWSASGQPPGGSTEVGWRSS